MLSLATLEGKLASELTLLMPLHTTKPLIKVLQTSTVFSLPAQAGSPVATLSKACRQDDALKAS